MQLHTDFQEDEFSKLHSDPTLISSLLNSKIISISKIVRSSFRCLFLSCLNMQYGLVGIGSATDWYFRDSQSKAIFSVICMVIRGCCLMLYYIEPMDSHRHFLCVIIFHHWCIVVSAATTIEVVASVAAAVQYQHHCYSGHLSCRRFYRRCYATWCDVHSMLVFSAATDVDVDVVVL